MSIMAFGTQGFSFKKTFDHRNCAVPFCFVSRLSSNSLLCPCLRYFCKISFLISDLLNFLIMFPSSVIDFLMPTTSMISATNAGSSHCVFNRKSDSKSLFFYPLYLHFSNIPIQFPSPYLLRLRVFHIKCYKYPNEFHDRDKIEFPWAIFAETFSLSCSHRRYMPQHVFSALT